VWDEHLGGRYDHTYALWNLLMFQAWLAAERGRLDPGRFPRQVEEPAGWRSKGRGDENSLISVPSVPSV
jgi:hypothetical protein